MREGAELAEFRDDGCDYVAEKHGSDGELVVDDAGFTEKAARLGWGRPSYTRLASSV